MPIPSRLAPLVSLVSLLALASSSAGCTLAGADGAPAPLPAASAAPPPARLPPGFAVPLVPAKPVVCPTTCNGRPCSPLSPCAPPPASAGGGGATSVVVVAGGSGGSGGSTDMASDAPNVPDWATSAFASTDPGGGSVGASMPFPAIDVGGPIASSDPPAGGDVGDTGAWTGDTGGGSIDSGASDDSGYDASGGGSDDSGGSWIDDSGGGATDCPDPAPDTGSDDGSFFDDGCPDCLILRPPPPRRSCPR